MASQVSVTLRMVDQFSQKMDAMAESSEKAQDRIVNFGEYSNAAMDKVTNSANRVSSSMENAANKTEDITGSSSRAQEAFENQASTADKCAEEVDKYGEEVEDATEKSEDFGIKGSEAAINLGNALVAAGIVVALNAIAAAYKECDEAADQFEVSMAKVSTIADETALSLGEMQSQITDLSNQTGVAASDLAEAAYGAISASVDTANAVQFVEQANALAVGGFTQQATAVDVLTTAINAYNMEADQTTHISDVLITTQNLGKTTVDELASSMGMVIPTAAAYNVSLENLAASYAVMTASGINTANATTNLNRVMAELADSGSEVAGVLEEQTGKSFAELMNEGASLGDIMQILGDSVDGDTVAFSNLWGSAVAGRGALSLLNAGSEKFNATLNQMEDSAGAADAAFEKMSGTGEFVEKRFQTAVENLKIAIGNAQPSLDGVTEALTGIIENITDFVNKHPEVVQAITGIAVGLGTFVAALAAYKVATLAAEVATKIFTAALDVNPIFLIITAIASLTTAIGTYVSSLGDIIDIDEELTGTSKDLQDAMEDQREEVEKLTKKYGKENDKVKEAEAELRNLEDEYESAKMTIGEFRKKVEDTAETIKKSADAFDENCDAIRNTGIEALALVQQIEKLDAVANKSDAQKELEAQLVEQLNEMYPELGASYDSITGKLGKSTDAVREFIKEQEKEAKFAAVKEALTEAYKNQALAAVTLADAEDTVTAARERAEEAARAIQDDDMVNQEEIDNFYALCDALDEETFTLGEAQAAADEANDAVSRLENAYEELANDVTVTDDATNDFINTTEGLKEGMQGVFDSVAEDAQELVKAYQEAKQAARDAIDSSFGLFDTLTTETTYKADEMIAALESQATYLKNYNDNIQAAKDLGLDESLVEHLADGSTESAAQLQAIIDKVNEFGDNKDKAQEFVDSMNESFKGVETAKETLATTMTQMNTELNEKMTSLENRMKEGVNKLNLSSEAATAATATMNAYLTNLQAYGDQAVAYAQGVAARVMAALNGAGALSSAGAAYEKTQTPKHAAGTTFGEDVYIAGERGPELIVGRRGSEVFPASETAKILDAVVTQNSTSNRNVNITLNGRGMVGLSKGVSKEDVMSILRENLETAVEEVIMREVLEEGDVDYVF